MVGICFMSSGENVVLSFVDMEETIAFPNKGSSSSNQERGQCSESLL